MARFYLPAIVHANVALKRPVALSQQAGERNVTVMSDLRIGLIGGTGLGQELVTNHHAGGCRHDVDTPFGKPSDAIIETEIAGLSVLILNRHGPGHLLNPSAVPSRANIFALKSLGCTHIIASGAVGSLREELRPRDVVVIDQFIDKTCGRKGTFFEQAAVHTEFAEPCCPILRKLLTGAAEAITARGEHDFKVHSRGCYVCMEGPAFSTRAESLMHRLWGGELIGMTALPEARLAREAEIPYALLALVTDYDCWRNKPTGAPVDSAELLKEIIGNLQVATHNTITLIQAALAMAKEYEAQLMAAPAREALKLAIWSDKTRIAPEEVRRLAPLWGKYFPAG